MIWKFTIQLFWKIWNSSLAIYGKFYIQLTDSAAVLMKGFIFYNKTAWLNMCLVLVVLGKVVWLHDNIVLKKELYGKKRTPKLNS